MQIVTGATGELHITSDMDGALHAGTFGDGCYVLPTRQEAGCLDYGAGFMTIAPGDIVMNGRHGVIAQAETVTLDPGTTGLNRNDLVCVRYSVDTEGIESMALVVIKGQAVNGTASDPAYNSTSILDGGNPADFPLYRVPFVGAAIGAPVRLFEVLDGGIYDLWENKSATGHKHSASDVTSGTLTVARGGTGLTSSPSLLVNLASGSAANVMQASPRPGVTGTLPVAHGGTGKATNTANAVLVGNGTGAVKNVASASGALYATAANGAPKFGALPIAQGGTGKTTAADARAALGAAASGWTQVATTSGTTAKSFTSLSTSGYKEIMLAAVISTSYQGSTVLPIAQISSTERDVVLPGGSTGNATGRYAHCLLTLTKMTPKSIWYDNSWKNANWYLYAR